MNGNTWKTRDGTVIPIKDLEDSHLLNIIKYIENKAFYGMYVQQICGDTFDIRNCDVFTEEIKGEEVYDYFYPVYDNLLKEKSKRKL